MSMTLEVAKKLEGRVVEEKFALQRCLGGGERSAVFLTERGGQRSAIKLIAAENIDEEAQLARWNAAAKFSHPHVIRLFESGRCEIDGARFLYVAMEYADETLAEILPLRALSGEEASDMLAPASDALSALHRAGLAHGSVKPSNVLAAANQLKLSGDSAGQVGERSAVHVSSAYDAPEMEASGPTPAADVWSLGATLVAVLTQSEPHETNGGRGSIAVLGTIPEPLRGIARECLRDDAAQRITAEGILRRLRPAAVAKEVRATAAAQERPKRWVIVPIVALALFVAALVGSRILSHRSATPAEETQPTAPQKPADVQEQKPAPVVEKPTQKGVTRGGVVHQVMPDVSRGAQNSITGHVKVSVQVAVDAAGNVSQAKLVSAGPSRYFAERALAAARQWKFTPAQVDGQASASEWLLRFQFGRGSMQVLPSEIRP